MTELYPSSLTLAKHLWQDTCCIIVLDLIPGDSGQPALSPPVNMADTSPSDYFHKATAMSPGNMSNSAG